MAGRITISTEIAAPVEMVWDYYTKPEHIVNWNHASDDWHTMSADNDIRPGGMFNFRMEAKDGSEGFDFVGTYDNVQEYEFIAYTMGDGRKAEVAFKPTGDATYVEISFDAENENPLSMQESGWRAILENFRRYVEADAR